MAYELPAPEDATLGQWAGNLSVAEDGYELRVDVATLPANPHLHGSWIVPKGDWAKRVLVMSKRSPSDLHRRFAAIGRVPFQRQGRKAVEFANRWGLLGDTSPENDRRTSYAWNEPPFMCIENLHTWRHRADMVAAWVAWWDLIQFNPAALRQHVLWDGATNSLRYFFSFDGDGLSTERNFFVRYRTPTWGDDQGIQRWDEVVNGQTQIGERMFRVYRELHGPKFDAAQAARLVLYRQIEKQLAGNVRVGFFLRRDPPGALMIYPTGLWGTIWMHFAREVMGKSSAALQPCANPRCDAMFSPRPNKRCCSDGCRKTLNRLPKGAPA